MAATRYMIMSLLGSGMLLLGICFLYGITGQLLMSNIQESVSKIHLSGVYDTPLIVALGLMSVGLAVKSALFPFHGWLPDAYGYSTVSSAAILSSLVSKGYIFLLLKIFYRVVGFVIVQESTVIHVLFGGILGMIIGSVDVRANSIRRMIACSSVAQISYIYMGFGLGTTAGVFHIISHAAAKSLLFCFSVRHTDASGDSTDFFDLTGMTIGTRLPVWLLRQVRFPWSDFRCFPGLSRKLCLRAAVGHAHKMLPTLIALAISTILNTVYFLKTVIRLYTPVKRQETKEKQYRTVTMRQQP
ncbi:MAG: proton-conducting transporter membrane subunit [Gallintestinimicrobium sp.]